MRIGEVAAQAGVHVQTVRLYERLGLLPAPGRLASGYRDYAADAVLLIRFIKRAQQLGFTLSEIKTLSTLRAQGDGSAADFRQMATAKLAEIDRKITHLQEVRNAIAHGMAVCQCRDPYPLCLLVKMREQAAEESSEEVSISQERST